MQNGRQLLKNPDYAQTRSGGGFECNRLLTAVDFRLACDRTNISLRLTCLILGAA